MGVANLILNAVMEKRISLESRGKEASQVTELNLDNVRTVGEFEGLTDNFENLEKLSVTAAGLTSFKGFPKLKSLKKLDVSDNRISNGLHALKNCHSLTHISLSNNKFKDISSLEPLKCLENLKHLEAANNPFTEEEEDPSNLQLSWEMLELAKVAYTNKLATADEEKKLVEMKICEVLLTLGEVSLESETYEQAVADITECLTKRKVLHEADSRRIAETHYHLGVALGHFNKFDEAVSALQSAIDCIKLRIENLKNKKESKDESKADDAFYTRETEITELEALLPEIEEKIQDTKDMKEQSKESQAEDSTGFANGDNKAAKPISTISVKRKAEGTDNASPKKAHLENGDKN